MNWSKIFALSLRHIYLIKGSFPRILDLIYWPTIQIFLWGFISKFFTLNSSLYENTVGVILSAAILYDFLFRSSISYNMMFLEEIWSRNFTNLFIAPIKLCEIIAALTLTAILRTLIGLVPAVLLAIPLFGVSILNIGVPLVFLLITLYIYYPIDILPNWLQVIAKFLPLVHIFEEMRNILIHDTINYYQILKAIFISFVYFVIGIIIFYLSYNGAKNRGTLINMGE